MWFGYENDSNWISLDLERVKEIMAMNEKGILPETLLQIQEGELTAEQKKAKEIANEKVAIKTLDKKLKNREIKKKKQNVQNVKEKKNSPKKGNKFPPRNKQ